MLHIVLTASDGGTAWRHALSPDEARAGWECVGPLGFAKRLGRLYGLRGDPAPHAERVSSFAARLAQLDDGERSFSRSRASDPWGVAGYLLGLRDQLRAAGWDGAVLDHSPRLADISAAEHLERPGLSPVPPALSDVYAALLVAVDATALPEPIAIRIAAPHAALDLVVRKVVTALAVKGAEVEDLAPERPAAPATTDLGRLQRALLDDVRGPPGPALSNDGSVLVLEADTPLEAAELAAASARTSSLAGATVVAGRDFGALDTAFTRHGLPAIGSSERSRWRPALQVLPLRLALSFAPRDPFRAAELLMLPVTPVPWVLRRRLLDALVEQPGIGSPAWNRAVDDAVQEAVSRARREAPENPERAALEVERKLREQLESWFGGPAHDPEVGIPAPEALRLCETVARWGEARGHFTEDPMLQGAARVARALARILAEQPLGTSLTPVQLEQLHDIAAGDGLDGGRVHGEAGRAAVALDPGAVAQSPVPEVLWWGFLGGEPGPAPEPWTSAEREGLVARGVRVPEPGAKRAAEAMGWRQPVLAASQRLVLVRWRLEGTEHTVPHPLTDVIAARLTGALAPCTVASEAVLASKITSYAAALSDRAPAPEVTPRSVMKVPPETISTARLSPSSLEKLFGCPIAWVLEYGAGLRRRGIARIPSGNRLLGTFAHALLEDLLHGPGKLDLETATPEDAAVWVGRAFDDRVALEAAPLVARGAEVERHRARELVCEAARSLIVVLQVGGWKVRGTEEKLSGQFEGAQMAGSADLVLEKDGQPAVLDLKLAKPRYFREKLENGEALQIALYADLARGDGPLPPTGYFLIGQGEIYTVDDDAFPAARKLTGPTTQETLDRARDALSFWRRVLGSGVVVSRHEALRESANSAAREAALEEVPDHGPGAIDPPCRFCDYGSLCGVELREVAR